MKWKPDYQKISNKALCVAGLLFAQMVVITLPSIFLRLFGISEMYDEKARYVFYILLLLCNLSCLVVLFSDILRNIEEKGKCYNLIQKITNKKRDNN